MAALNVIAQEIVNAQRKAPYLPGENLLFQYLYDAYCKLEKQDRNFETVRSKAKADGNNYAYMDASRELASWYTAKYPASGTGNRGIDRAVTSKSVEDGTYRFDEPILPDRFTAYLVDGKPIQKSDARDFILHSAVAFLLAPEQLEHLLIKYGFHPLHVRNIHHLAIYTVLRAVQELEMSERQECKPFQEVRKIYDAARLLITQVQPADFSQQLEGEEEAFCSGSTRKVQRYIIRQKLSKDNLLTFIGNHSEFYHMRHRRLLQEHKRLVNLFSVLYITRGDTLPESQYSLYQFLSTFCKDFERKRFNDQIYVHVAKNQRHPTRELMIVLWIYAYSFLFYPKVSVLRDFSKVIPFKAISKALEEPPKYPFAKYFDKRLDQFRVLEYLSDASSRASPLCGFYDGSTLHGTFKGNELVAFINEKLKDYSWRQLDGKNSFDHIVQCLSPLQITMNKDGDIERASYGEEDIDNAGGMNVDNVPAPLVVISKLLQCINDVENQGIKDTKRQKLPLSCDLYELI